MSRNRNVWLKAYSFLLPYGQAFAQHPNMTRIIVGWDAFTHHTGLERDKSRAAYRRALKELREVYGVDLATSDATTFTLERVGG